MLFQNLGEDSELSPLGHPLPPISVHLVPVQ